jgi:hypothetical protein
MHSVFLVKSDVTSSPLPSTLSIAVDVLPPHRRGHPPTALSCKSSHCAAIDGPLLAAAVDHTHVCHAGAAIPVVTGA